VLQFHGSVPALSREDPKVLSAIDDYLNRVGGCRRSGIDFFGCFNFVVPEEGSQQAFNMVNEIEHVQQVDWGHMSFAQRSC